MVWDVAGPVLRVLKKQENGKWKKEWKGEGTSSPGKAPVVIPQLQIRSLLAGLLQLVHESVVLIFNQG